jgi:hypothetical protein
MSDGRHNSSCCNHLPWDPALGYSIRYVPETFILIVFCSVHKSIQAIVPFVGDSQ